MNCCFMKMTRTPLAFVKSMARRDMNEVLGLGFCLNNI